MTRSEDLPSPRGPRAVAAAIVVCVVAGSLLELRQFRAERRAEAEADLIAVAEIKAAEVARWREERLSDGRVIATSKLAARAAEGAQRGSNSEREDLAEWCAAEAAQHDEYSAAAVFGPRGERLAAAGRDAEALAAGEHLDDTRRGGKAVLSELHLSDRGELHADLVAPLPREAADGSFVGHVVLRIDPAWHLVPSVEAWPGLGDSADAVLVQRPRPPAVGPIVLVTRERVTIVARAPDADPLAAAVARGASGLLEALDERGHLVRAAVHPVPDSSLAVMVKLDASAIDAPVRDRALWLLLLGAAIAMAVVFATRLWWRAQLDVFHRRQHDAELRRLALERHFGYLTRYAQDILLLLDEGLRVVEANDRAVEAYGYAREELLGIHVRELLAPRARADLDRRRLDIGTEEGATFESRHVRRDGTTFPVEVSARVIEVEGERYRQAIVRDISRRKRTERALRASEERLQLAVEASGLAVWDWSRRGGGLHFDPGVLGILGYGPGELRTLAALRRLLHPQDRAATERLARELPREHGPAVEAEVRVRTRQGSWKRVRLWMRVLERDPEGRPARLAGALADLSGREEANRLDGVG